MPALAALLIPLLPGLINGVMNIVDAIRTHDATPADTKAHLDQIAADLADLNQRVQDTPLP
jgi:hypothetical protein